MLVSGLSFASPVVSVQDGLDLFEGMNLTTLDIK